MESSPSESQAGARRPFADAELMETPDSDARGADRVYPQPDPFVSLCVGTRSKGLESFSVSGTQAQAQSSLLNLIVSHSFGFLF
ncbi:unnamed protein product [Urochloa humidicola]